MNLKERSSNWGGQGFEAQQRLSVTASIFETMVICQLPKWSHRVGVLKLHSHCCQLDVEYYSKHFYTNPKLWHITCESMVYVLYQIKSNPNFIEKMCKSDSV